MNFRRTRFEAFGKLGFAAILKGGIMREKMIAAMAAGSLVVAPTAAQAVTAVQRSSESAAEANEARSSLIWIALLIAVVIATALLVSGGNKNNTPISS